MLISQEKSFPLLDCKEIFSVQGQITDRFHKTPLIYNKHSYVINFEKMPICCTFNCLVHGFLCCFHNSA